MLRLKGIDLVETAADMLQGGRKVTVPDIALNLRERGVYVPEGGTHINSMKQWLDKARLFSDGWRIDPKRYEELVGASSKELESLSGLTEQQKAFARAFARLGASEMPSNKVAEYARQLYGVRFSAKGLPQEVLFPLRDAGLLTCEKTTAGRGAKPYIVRPTERLRSDVLEPIFAALESAVGVKYRKLVRMPLSEITRGLTSKNTHEKGLALEALAFHLARLIDLTFVGWRLRSAQTAGAEVDVIVEGTRLIFSRWQMQCKNVIRVTLEDVAKEVGIAISLKSNVIMVVSTGRISESARRFAQTIMRDTNYNIILIDGTDLQVIGVSPTEITSILLREAKRAMEIKRLELENGNS
ncbi:MAG: restriction endonuclease [Candidatus Tectomicrobia bacterium]|nr:restriction endonuclease [Candidatus Tectomicrobia bacterium]